MTSVILAPWLLAAPPLGRAFCSLAGDRAGVPILAVAQAVALAALSVALWCGGSIRGRVACVASAISMIAVRCLAALLGDLAGTLRADEGFGVLQPFANEGGFLRADVSAALLLSIVLTMALHRQFLAALVPLSLLWLSGSGQDLHPGGLPAGISLGLAAAAFVRLRPVSSFAKRVTFGGIVIGHALVGTDAPGRGSGDGRRRR